MSTRRAASRGRGPLADVALAMVRLPWAMGFWTLHQATSLIDPRRSLNQAVKNLNALSEAAAEPLDGTMADLHRAGEHFQNGWVDSAHSLTSGSWREPRAALDEAWQTLGRTWQSARSTGGKGRR